MALWTVSATVDDPLALLARRARLLRLRDDLDTELVTIEHQLRDRGAPGMAGRPRKEYTMTREQAKEAHRLYNAGQRSEWIDRGEREYGRRARREQRIRQAGKRQAGLDSKSAGTGGPA